MKKLRWFLPIYFLSTCVILSAQNGAPDPAYKLISGQNIVQSKNYYLLTLFEENEEVKKLLESDKQLAEITLAKSGKLQLSLKDCNNNAACLIERMKFGEQEIKQISNRLAELCTTSNALGRLVQQDLIRSGTYILFNNLSPQQLLVKAWEQDANGINFTIGVYAEGKKANYPLIDSISFNVNDTHYGSFLYNNAYLLSQEFNSSKLFFTIPLKASLHFLEINERDNAADFEPMISTVNKEAFDKIKSVKWNNYKYSVILVPGAGPDGLGMPLSSEAMIRCRLAAIQYNDRISPFIIVSGGRVHPYKTKYSEAIEMKKFLMEKLSVPGSAIIVDPHARHTTTNMRNGARLIFRYGIPFNKPGLAVTTRGQSSMISSTLAARCFKELMEVPFKNGTRLSETETEFYPLIEALQINPAEPMDP